MRSQASNTEKELKKDKFRTANRADTIQPKSMDGLQNHADTLKLIRVKTAAEQSNHHKKLTQFKTAAEQSNRHEKLTQLQSMGDARAHRIQNGGVVQLMLPALARGAVAAARGAGRVVARGPAMGAARPAMGAARPAMGGIPTAMGGAPIRVMSTAAYRKPPLDTITKVMKFLAALNTAATILDNGSGLGVGVIINDQKAIFENALGLLAVGIDQSNLPDVFKDHANEFIATLGEFAELIPELEVKPFDPTFYQMDEGIREYFKAIDEFVPGEIGDTIIKLDNAYSRIIGFSEEIRGRIEFLKTDREDRDRDLKKDFTERNEEWDQKNPALAALHKQYKYVGDEGYDQGPKHPEEAGGFMK